MSSDKELNRAKWQRHKPSLNKKNSKESKQQNLTTSSYIKSQSIEATGTDQTSQMVHQIKKDSTDYLDNFDLDFEELGAEEGVPTFNSDGFDFEKLLQEAKNDSYIRRQWSMSQEFEDKQAFLEQPSEVLQVDLLSLGAALQDLPLHYLFGIDISFFDKETQALAWVSPDHYQKADQIPEIKEEESSQETDATTPIPDHENNFTNQPSYKNQQVDSSDVRQYQQEDESDIEELINRQEDDLDSLLQGTGASHFAERIFNYRHEINNSNNSNQQVRKSGNQNSQQFNSSLIGSSNLLNQDKQDDIDDELDRLLQL